MKKRKIKSKIIIIIMLLFLVTGCQTTLVNEDNKAVLNPETGQSLTENILCQPENTQETAFFPSCCVPPAAGQWRFPFCRKCGILNAPNHFTSEKEIRS